MKQSVRILILPLFSILLLSNTIYAQWTETYPYGGVFNAVVANGTTFFAGSSEGALFMTTNNGTNWTQIGSNQNFGNIYSLLFDAPNLYVGCFNGVFQTSDNGNKWTLIINGLNNTEIKALAKYGDNIYAGNSAGLYYLVQDNNTWIPIYGGLPGEGILSIAADGTQLFVLTSNSGVYRSTDGMSWTVFNKGLPSSNNFAIAAGTNYLFAGTSQGIYRTPLASNNWTKVTNQSNSFGSLCLAVYDKYTFAGVQLGGVMMSTDEGTTWNSFVSGMPLYSSPSSPFPGLYMSAHSFAVGSSYILAGTDNGIYSLALQSTTWNSADSGLNAGRVTSLLFNGSKIYAGASKGGFFISSDNGSRWYNYNAGLRDSPNVLDWYGSNVYSYGGSQGPLILDDTDMRWITTDSLHSINTGFWSILIYNSKIYIGTENGVWTAKLNYRGFAKISTGLPISTIYSLIASGNNLFAGIRNGGVYLSTNNGINWTAVNSGISNLTVHSLLSAGSSLFAGTDGGSALYVTTNNGTNWTQANSGLDAPRVFSLASGGTYIFAGTANGVYFSSNNGSSWKAVSSTNMKAQNIYSLLVIGDNLYAGGDNVIYKRLISEMTSVKDEEGLPAAFELRQNYPNPFNPVTTINYSVFKSSFVTIKVYDFLGREVTTLVHENKTSGNYSVEFNAGKLVSGVYFYRMQAGEFVQTKKLVLLK